MAGKSWVPVPSDLTEDPRFVRLSTRFIKVDRDAILGKLIRLWQWVSTQSEIDHLTGVSREMVDNMSGLPGFASALVDVGFMRSEAEGLKLTHFDSHLSTPAKARMGDTFRKAWDRRQRGGQPRPDTSRTSVPAAKSKENTRNSLSASKQSNLRKAESSGQMEPSPDSPLTQEQLQVATLLHDMNVNGDPLYSNLTAAEIARHPRANLLHVQWAISRLKEELERGRVKNPGGYLRSLIEEKDPPPRWKATARRIHLAACCGRFVAARVATSSSNDHPFRSDANLGANGPHDVARELQQLGRRG